MGFEKVSLQTATVYWPAGTNEKASAGRNAAAFCKDAGSNTFMPSPSCVHFTVSPDCNQVSFVPFFGRLCFHVMLAGTGWASGRQTTAYGTAPSLLCVK
jgi:hypothetical protein